MTAERVVTPPPAIVWAALLDLTHAGAWLEGVVRLEYEPSSPMSIGTVIAVEWQPRGAERSTTSSVVSALRPGALIALETRGKDLLSFDRALLEPTANGTRIEFVSELSERGASVLERLASPHDLFGNVRRAASVELAYERALDAFARHVESTYTVPYR